MHIAEKVIKNAIDAHVPPNLFLHSLHFGFPSSPPPRPPRSSCIPIAGSGASGVAASFPLLESLPSVACPPVPDFWALLMPALRLLLCGSWASPEDALFVACLSSGYWSLETEESVLRFLNVGDARLKERVYVVCTGRKVVDEVDVVVRVAVRRVVGAAIRR